MKHAKPMKIRSHNINRLHKRAGVILSLVVVAMSLLTTTHLIADDTYRVKASDNLNRIVTRHYVNSPFSKSQLMVAILSQNPRAFKGGNINFLMRGRKLVLPSIENIEVVSEEEAQAILSQHNRYFREGKTGDLSLSGLNLSSNDPVYLSAQHKSQKEKLKKLEEERRRLKSQLESLQNEKRNSDQQLEALEAKLEQSKAQKVELESELSKQKNIQTDNQQSYEGSNLHDDVISSEKKKRILNEQVKARTQKLEDNNAFLQKRLQQARSKLAENTRENISLERQLDFFKEQLNKEVKQASSQTSPQTSLKEKPGALTDADKKGLMQGDSDTGQLQESAGSVAAEIGAAKHSTESLDSSSGMFQKLAWVVLVLALFAGLWFLLRYFLTGRQSIQTSKNGDAYATPAFETGDSFTNENIDGENGTEAYFNDEHEEASLETSIKIDVARAYIEADDLQAASEMLQEVIEEGNAEQQQEAKEIIKTYNI